MRPLPFNIDAEQAVLGSLLIDPEAWKRTRALLAPGDFYRENHRELFLKMERLAAEGKLIEYVALFDAGADAGELSSLTSKTPTAIHLDHYAAIVKEHSDRRALITVADALNRMGYDDGLTVTEAMQRARGLIRDLTSQGQEADTHHITVATAMAIDDIELLMTRPDGPATPCALEGLRRLINGYHPAEQTVIGARPNTGKTSIAVEEALSAVQRHGKTVYVFSLEMGPKAIGKRVLARVGQLGLSRLRNGPITDHEHETALITHEGLAGAGLYLCTTPRLSAPEIHARCEALIRKVSKLDMVIVDYVGIMGSPFQRGGRGDDQKRLEVSANALQLREMARDLEVHNILLAQIGRSAMNRKESRPTLADLKESGTIEEVADNVILLHDASKTDSAAPRGLIELHVAKGRNDATGTAKALLDGPTGTWTDYNDTPGWAPPPPPPDPNGW
jgi:replicative DNA helicase